MQPPLLIGISGPSSSGKTTLSRLLRDIFPPSKLYILHLDDFYLTDAEIPVKDGVQDWDCMESLNLPELRQALLHIKECGQSPDWLISKEDQNSVGEHGVLEEDIRRLKEDIKHVLNGKDDWQDRRVCIVDGFLLFSEEMRDIRSLFDIKLFLRTSYDVAKRRREARSGYVTLEGFWEDPPGYVDQIVWPNYVKDHKFLFEKANVEGDLSKDVCKEVGIHGMPKEAEGNMTRCLQWAASILKNAIQNPLEDAHIAE